MLTPPNRCNLVALCSNRATCCFDTSQSRSGTAESGFRRVPSAESRHNRRLPPTRERDQERAGQRCSMMPSG
jgi:hypothetical protein